MNETNELKVNDMGMYFKLTEPDFGGDSLDELMVLFKYVDVEQVPYRWVSLLMDKLKPRTGEYPEIDGNYCRRSQFVTKLVNELGEEDYGKKLVEIVHKAKKVLVKEIVTLVENCQYGLAKTYGMNTGMLMRIVFYEPEVNWGDYPKNDRGRYLDVGRYILEEVRNQLPSSIENERVTWTIKDALALM